MADTIQATRMRKGMLIKINNDLFRVLELQHVTPGNLRGFVRAKFRNIRSGTLSDQKLRSEEWSIAPRSTTPDAIHVPRRGCLHFMDTESTSSAHHAEALGET